MKVYPLEATHWHTPGRPTQIYKENTGPGGAHEAALELVNMLRDYVKLSAGEDPTKWEEYLLEARKKRALELFGNDDVDELSAEDDAYVQIMEKDVIEPGERVFLYSPTLRPAGFATLPPGVGWEYVEAPSMVGLVQRNDLPVSKFLYGVIKTKRRLTDDECARFDLRQM